jgi:hypothetical protein
MADRQLAPGYGGLLAAFATIFSVGVVAARRGGHMPEHVRADDIALGGMATYKLARVLSKDRVTSPVRAPFTRGEGEQERPRGRGVRYVIGELFLCPFCLAQWIGAAYAMGLVFAPRVTRLIAAMMSVVALSDFLQLAYKGAENRRAAG